MEQIFQEEQVAYTGGRYDDEIFRYRLFCPDGHMQGDKLPLLLWLHGWGDKGENNIGQLKWLDLAVPEPEWKSEYRYYVLALQCPNENPSWFTGNSPADHMASIAVTALDKVCETKNVDVSRIYLAGVSSGGSACWKLGSLFPDKFAALIPMSGGGFDASKMERLVNTPVWAFHNHDDPKTSIGPVEKAVQNLKEAGGSVHLTALKGKEQLESRHDSWTGAFQEYGILDWMLQQRQGEPSLLYRPGISPLSFYWQKFAVAMTNPFIAVPLGLSVLVLWSAWRWKRYCNWRNRSPEQQPTSSLSI